MKLAAVLFALWTGAASAQCINCGVQPEIPSTGAAATPMKSIVAFLVGATASFSTSVTGYGVPFNGYNLTNFGTTETGIQWVVPIGGALTYLSQYRANATAGSWEFKTRVNQAAAAGDCLEGAIVSTAASCQDTTHSDTLNPGDLIGLQSTPTSSPAANTLMPIAALFTSTNANEGMLIGSTSSPVTNTQDTFYSGFQSTLGPNASEIAVSCLVSTSGTLDNLYIRSRVAPGVSDVVTVYHENAGSCSTPAVTPGPLAATITAAATTGNDLNGAHGFHVAPGDCVSVKLSVPAGATSTSISYGMRWKPDNKGESLYCSTGTTQSATASATRLYGLTGPNAATGNSSQATEWYLPNIPGIFYTVDAMSFLGDTQPGGAASRAYTIRQASVSGSTFTASNTATTCTQNATDLFCNGVTPSSITPGNFLDLAAVNTSTPAAGTMLKFGFTLKVQ